MEIKAKDNSSTDAKNKQLEYDVLYTKNSFTNFKEELAKLLCDSKVKVEPKESNILENIKNLMLSTKERGMVSELVKYVHFLLKIYIQVN